MNPSLQRIALRGAFACTLLFVACGSTDAVQPSSPSGGAGGVVSGGASGSGTAGASGAAPSGGNPNAGTGGSAGASPAEGNDDAGSGNESGGRAGSAGGPGGASGGSQTDAAAEAAGGGGITSPGGTDGASRAMQIVAAMGTGWNLGNTLESLGVKDETGWGNPKTTKAMIDGIKSAGFATLRLPTSWDDHFSGANYTIESAWLDRVEEVANYGLSNNMYVIVNIHHSNGWENTTAANEANAKDHLTKLWMQIATRFSKYNDHLIFETMNEPRNGDDWTGKQEYYDVINRLNVAAVTTIRATGGNNTNRLIMVPGYCASPQPMQIDAFVLPNDKMLAVSTHSYIPYSFALDSTGTSSFSDTSEIDSTISRLSTMFVKKGIPVVMGEWASTNKNNLSDRVRHAEYYVKAAKGAGIPCVWWDNQNFVANTSDSMGLFDRKALNWKFPDILTSLMNGLK